MFYAFGTIHGLVAMSIIVIALWMGVGPLVGSIALTVCALWLILCLHCARREGQ